jgi:pyocin large subunit-like protein
MILVHKAGQIGAGPTPSMPITPNGAVVPVVVATTEQAAIAGARAGALLMAAGSNDIDKALTDGHVPAPAPAEEKAAEVKQADTQKLKFENFAEGKLYEHYDKHVIQRAEWGPGAPLTQEVYLQKARELLNSRIEGDIEGFVSKNGYTFRYNRATNELATAKPDGTIETIFRPKDGHVYWLEQIVKYK